MQLSHYTCLRLITVHHQRRSTWKPMPYPTIITYHGTRMTVSEMDFPDSHDLEVDKWKIENCTQSSEISGTFKTDQTTGTTGDCNLNAWMLTTLSSRSNNTDPVTDKISHNYNPDAWTPVYPRTSFSQSDITRLTTTDNNNCSTNETYQRTTTANTYQQTTTVNCSPDIVQTTQPCYTSIIPRRNAHPKGPCTCTCKCCT